MFEVQNSKFAENKICKYIQLPFNIQCKFFSEHKNHNPLFNAILLKIIRSIDHQYILCNDEKLT